MIYLAPNVSGATVQTAWARLRRSQDSVMCELLSGAGYGSITCNLDGPNKSFLSLNKEHKLGFVQLVTNVNALSETVGRITDLGDVKQIESTLN